MKVESAVADVDNDGLEDVFIGGTVGTQDNCILKTKGIYKKDENFSQFLRF